MNKKEIVNKAWCFIFCVLIFILVYALGLSMHTHFTFQVEEIASLVKEPDFHVIYIGDGFLSDFVKVKDLNTAKKLCQMIGGNHCCTSDNERYSYCGIKIPACPACELYPARCPTCEKPICEKPKFQEIAENLASEENYRDKYNCEDFSKELIRRLKDAGYRAKYCTGTALWCDPKESEFSCRHTWVRIDGLYVEATNGGILTPEQFKEGYKLVRCG